MKRHFEARSTIGIFVGAGTDGLLPSLSFSCKTHDVADRERPIEVSPLSSLRVKKTAGKPEITDQIGRHLRSVYNDVLVQPVPDRFLDLLKDLDALPKKGSPDQPGDEKAAK